MNEPLPIRDAATLILTRRAAAGPQILMGQRAKGHVFMPNLWVFPGGRVDEADFSAPAECELDARTEALLRLHCSFEPPRALPLAALRELREETGLIAAARLDSYAFIARAITPPGRPRRFDARFFMGDADLVLKEDRAPAAGDGELLHTRWFSPDEALALDLPDITRLIMREVRARLEGASARPLFFRGGTEGVLTERL